LSKVKVTGNKNVKTVLDDRTGRPTCCVCRRL